jgi:hypothetical protein
MTQIHSDVVYLNDFFEFPAMSINANQGTIIFNHYAKHKSMQEINSSRMEYFNQRLMQAEERIFSHVDMYQRAKLSDRQSSGSQIRTVYNVHSVLGSNERKWVLGILS